MRAVRFIKDPWFNLGIHIDHKALYLAIHLPCVRILIGRPPLSSYVVTCDDKRWVILDRPFREGEKTRLRNAVNRVGQGRVRE